MTTHQFIERKLHATVELALHELMCGHRTAGVVIGLLGGY